MQVSANPSSPGLGVGLGRVGQGREGLGLGCAIRTLGNHPKLQIDNLGLLVFSTGAKV